MKTTLLFTGLFFSMVFQLKGQKPLTIYENVKPQYFELLDQNDSIVQIVHTRVVKSKERPVQIMLSTVNLNTNMVVSSILRKDKMTNLVAAAENEHFLFTLYQFYHKCFLYRRDKRNPTNGRLENLDAVYSDLAIINDTLFMCAYGRERGVIALDCNSLKTIWNNIERKNVFASTWNELISPRIVRTKENEFVVISLENDTSECKNLIKFCYLKCNGDTLGSDSVVTDLHGIESISCTKHNNFTLAGYGSDYKTRESLNVSFKNYGIISKHEGYTFDEFKDSHQVKTRNGGTMTVIFPKYLVDNSLKAINENQSLIINVQKLIFPQMLKRKDAYYFFGVCLSEKTGWQFVMVKHPIEN